MLNLHNTNCKIIKKNLFFGIFLLKYIQTCVTINSIFTNVNLCCNFGTYIPPVGEKGVGKGKNEIYLYPAAPVGRIAVSMC